MTTYKFKIDEYELLVCNRPIGHGDVRSIHMKGNDRHGTPRWAVAGFYPGDPAASVNVQTNDVMYAVFPMSAWDAIVDVLRNESPVYFEGIEPTLCKIQTTEEPVGEEES